MVSRQKGALKTSLVAFGVQKLAPLAGGPHTFETPWERAQALLYDKFVFQNFLITQKTHLRLRKCAFTLLI